MANTADWAAQGWEMVKLEMAHGTHGLSRKNRK